MKVWDSHTGKLLRTFRGHTGLVSSLAFTHDGKLLVSGSRDHTVKFWDMTPLEEAVRPVTNPSAATTDGSAGPITLKKAMQPCSHSQGPPRDAASR